MQNPFRFPWSRRPPTQESGEFSLDTPLVWFSDKDCWTVRDACAGTQILGTVGSGKTSGSGATLARAMLRQGFGGLVLCAKVEEYPDWYRYCDQTGRLDSLIRFAPEEPYRFNFLDYELNRVGRGGGLTENLVNLFVTCAKVSDSGAGQQNGGQNQEFWDKALKQLLRNIIDLLSIAKGTLNMRDMYRLVTSAPNTQGVPDGSFWFECMNEAQNKADNGYLTPSQMRDFDTTRLYWEEFTDLDPETKSNVVITFSSLADMFLRGVLADMFCSGTNLFPAELAAEGMIIALDLPVHEYRQVGLVGQVLMKYIFQQTIQRRNVDRFTRPVALWVDEAQLFCNAHDQTFLTTSRSARVST